MASELESISSFYYLDGNGVLDEYYPGRLVTLKDHKLPLIVARVRQLTTAPQAVTKKKTSTVSSAGFSASIAIRQRCPSQNDQDAVGSGSLQRLERLPRSIPTNEIPP